MIYDEPPPREPSEPAWTWPRKGPMLVRFSAPEIRLFAITALGTVAAGVIAAVMLFVGVALYRLFQQSKTAMWWVFVLWLMSAAFFAIYPMMVRHYAGLRREWTGRVGRAYVAFVTAYGKLVLAITVIYFVLLGLTLLAYVTLSVR